MQIDKHEKKHKQYLAWEKEYNEILGKLRVLPLIPLPEPIQKGWKVTYSLREDVARRDDAHIIKIVLEKGYYSDTHISKVEHVKMIRRGEKGYTTTSSKGEKTWHSFLSSKRTLSREQYEALDIRVRKYFYLDTVCEAYRKYGREYYYVYLPDWYIVMRVRPFFHTHYRDKGGELEKRYEWLRDKIHEYWVLNSGGYSQSYPAYKDRAKVRDKIQKFLKGEIDDISNEKIPKEYDY